MSDGEPFRKAPAAPAALRALVARGPTTDRPLPRDAASRSDLDRRIARAADLEHGNPSMSGVAVGVTIVCVGVGVSAPFLVFCGLAFGGYSFVRSMIGGPPSDEAVARFLAASSRFPFPIEGYGLWLASEVPMFDVHLRAEVDQKLVADAARTLDPRIAIEWLRPGAFRVSIPPQRRSETYYCGDRLAWERFADKILLPIHQDVGIEKVEMGGSMRALPPG